MLHTTSDPARKAWSIAKREADDDDVFGSALLVYEEILIELADEAEREE